MDLTSAQLSKEEHNKIFLKLERQVLRKLDPPKEGEALTAVFLAGQPGSGKGTLNERTLKELDPKRTIAIDVDALRELHPKYDEWRKNPETEKDAATCRACGVEPYAYLRHVLTELPHRAEGTDFRDLLPVNYANDTAS